MCRYSHSATTCSNQPPHYRVTWWCFISMTALAGHLRCTQHSGAQTTTQLIQHLEHTAGLYVHNFVPQGGGPVMPTQKLQFTPLLYNSSMCCTTLTRSGFRLLYKCSSQNRITKSSPAHQHGTYPSSRLLAAHTCCCCCWPRCSCWSCAINTCWKP